MEDSALARPPLESPQEVLWRLSQGRLTEVSGSGGGAGLTLAAAWVASVQRQGGLALWLSAPTKPVYPPDLEAAGVLLEWLPFLFLSDLEQAGRVALRLLSSGGLDALVWDLASWKAPPDRLTTALLGRLGALARHHRTPVLFLTDKPPEAASLSPLIGWRLGAEAEPDRPHRVRVRVLKDKRGGVGQGREWLWRCRLPEGVSVRDLRPDREAGPAASERPELNDEWALSSRACLDCGDDMALK